MPWAALAGPPFDGRWRSVTWRGNGGFDAHVVDDAGEGGRLTLCGMIVPFGPSLAALRPEFQEDGGVTCRPCLEWLTVPYPQRWRPPGLTIPEWNRLRATLMVRSSEAPVLDDPPGGTPQDGPTLWDAPSDEG